MKWKYNFKISIASSYINRYHSITKHIKNVCVHDYEINVRRMFAFILQYLCLKVDKVN